MMLQVNLHYLAEFGESVDIPNLHLLLLQRNRRLFDEANLPMLRAISEQPAIKAGYRNYNENAIIIGKDSEISTETSDAIQNQLREFCPWRKGPFSIFGTGIDAEWRSDLKWNRLAPHMDSFEDKVIADVGCNNGYFMFKCAASNPRLVLGMDPTRKFKLAFHYLNQFAGEQKLRMELLGFEDLKYFNEIFDALFCMGIIYHHQDPMEVIRLCYGSLKKGGQLLFETMGISSNEEICLFPRKRYANMKNVWFIPSQKAVENMLERAGFREIQCVYNEFLDTGEQRRTPWADVESLADFLKPDNPRQTIEGYEAPSRIYFVARK